MRNGTTDRNMKLYSNVLYISIYGLFIIFYIIARVYVCINESKL